MDLSSTDADCNIDGYIDGMARKKKGPNRRFFHFHDDSGECRCKVPKKQQVLANYVAILVHVLQKGHSLLMFLMFFFVVW